MTSATYQWSMASNNIVDGLAAEDECCGFQVSTLLLWTESPQTGMESGQMSCDS